MCEKVLNLYCEKEGFGNRYREEKLLQLNRLIELERKKADTARKGYFKPDFSSVPNYVNSIVHYREEFLSMLGWPLCPKPVEAMQMDVVEEFVAEDDLGCIYRMNIPAISCMTTYGLLFLPKKEGPHPLIIAQHGGAGTPEVCAGFFGSGNYNNMVRRVLKRGFAVFVPQLLLWDAERFGPVYDRKHMDNQLKQLGGSITALEVCQIRTSLDFLLSREDICSDKVGMIGLSYGGFYTLFTAAAEPRIKASLVSCFFNNRFIYDWSDWIWFNAGNTFLDAEVCGLVCPRPLYIEAGIKDDLFDVKYAREEYMKVKEIYEKVGVGKKLKFKEFRGGHELNVEDEGIEFICSALEV